MRFDDDGNIIGLSWTLPLFHPDSREPLGDIPFQMPIQPDRTLKTLEREAPPRYRTLAQAYRVAWRILKDWTEAQLALVQSGQVDFAQAFLAYVEGADGTTLYRHMLSGGFQSMLALPTPSTTGR